MTILTNFKKYQPEDSQKLILQKELGISFIKSAEGVDWYESQDLFDKSKLKIIFDLDTGKILSVSVDISSLWPDGSSVADTDYPLDTALEDVKNKVFDIQSGKIIDKKYTKAERKAQADKILAEKMTEVSALITPLQYAKDLSIITDKESEYLTELQRYVVYLSRVSSQEEYPENIQWPEMPEA